MLTFLGGLISFTRDAETQKENKTLVIENKRLLESNLSLSELIKNNLTGGDSYGVVSPLAILDNNKEVYFLYFENKGDFPLYDVIIKYWNPDVIKGKADPDGKASTEVLKYYKTVNCGNIPPKGGQALGSTFDLSDGEFVKFNISINAKNGSFSQLLRVTKKDGKLSIAKRINTIGEGSRIILEEVGLDFPKDANGQLDWK
ncbi:MAG: hypothetical protein K0S53_2747 [Bacteroidetes bacterium]|nr:hypothetical protein [Bacteroidota bacterium]MDF2451564.1 hypothetical protein [Bacteroidota bacterium]